MKQLSERRAASLSAKLTRHAWTLLAHVGLRSMASACFRRARALDPQAARHVRRELRSVELMLHPLARIQRPAPLSARDGGDFPVLDRK
jgi:hypothetical protein